MFWIFILNNKSHDCNHKLTYRCLNSSFVNMVKGVQQPPKQFSSGAKIAHPFPSFDMFERKYIK